MPFNRTALLIGLLTMLYRPTVDAVESASDTSPVLAKVGDVALTEAQMRSDLAFGLYEAENNVYLLKKNWVEQKAQNILFDKAAKEAKLSRAAWEKREIDDKVVPATPEEVTSVATMMTRGQAVTPEIETKAKQYLANQRRTMRISAVYGSLSSSIPVQLSLLPPAQPSIDIAYTADNPVKGPKNAPVTIMEFIDYECPPCRESQSYVKAAEQTYPGKVKIVVRNFPLTQIHNNAMPAAKFAVCAQEQGQFWPVHDKLFASQSALQEANLKQYAAEFKLNTKKLDACLSSAKTQKRIDMDMIDGQRYGVRGTPTFFVNGKRTNYNQLVDAVRTDLEKKN